MDMQGTLFKYGPLPANVAFKTLGTHKFHLIAVHGLTEGFLSMKYIQPLSLRQITLTSSYQGWGTGSISRDASEINALCKHLKKQYNSKGVAVLGHSTGCQDAVMHAAKYKNDPEAPPLIATILQAPVSDREFFSVVPTFNEINQKARECRDKGKLDEIAFIADLLDKAPVTARRWLSLIEKGGEDDMFSSDFTDEELKEKLGGLDGVPTLIMLSSRDEYRPMYADYIEVGRRIASSIGESARLEVMEGATHGLEKHVEEAVELMSEFIVSVVTKKEAESGLYSCM